MSHFDEQILSVKKEDVTYKQYLEKKNKQSAQIDSIKSSVFLVQGKEIILERLSFFEDTFTMLIPNTFEDKETEGDNYLFSIPSNDVHISLSAFSEAVRPMTLKEYKKKLMENMYKEAKVNIEWIEEGLHIEKALKITYFVFTIPLEESSVYNFIFFFSLNKKAYIVSCNCMQHQMDDWMILGKGLIETIDVLKQEEL